MDLTVAVTLERAGKTEADIFHSVPDHAKCLRRFMLAS